MQLRVQLLNIDEYLIEIGLLKITLLFMLYIASKPILWRSGSVVESWA